MSEVQKPLSWRVKTDTDKKFRDALDMIQSNQTAVREQSERIVVAQDTAYEAMTEAELAASAAASAQSSANTAQASADSAQSSANSAASAAASAQSTANDASAAAGSAASAAASAQSAANSAAAAAASAQTTANNAQSTANSASATASSALTLANGKNKVTPSATAPSSPTTNDLWVDTANANVIKIWNGSAWTIYKAGPGAISGVDATVIQGTLVAGQIATGAITTDKLYAGAVTASKLAVDALTAQNYYSGADGAARVSIGPAFYSGGYPVIYWDLEGNNVVNTTDPRIQGISDGLYLQGGASRGSLKMDGAGSNLTGTTSANKLTIDASNITAIHGGSSVVITNGGINFTAFSTAVLALSSSGAAFTGTLSATSNITTDGAFQSDYLQTSQGTGTANLNVATGAGGGTIKTITPSTKRIKKDITNLSPDLSAEALYNIPVRQFRYKDGVIPDTDIRHNKYVPGFVAEEVFEHYPIVVEKNSEGQIEDWNPRFLIPAMLKLIQDQHARITALEKKK